jgi:hypothetical protein
MSPHELPYSVSSGGSAYTTFDKLQGTKNYASWKNNMRTVLMSLRQWEVVTGTETAPTPADVDNPTPDETKAKKAWDGNFLPSS